MNKPFFFIAAASILLFTYLTINSAANWLESQPRLSNERFEVVDRYEGRCDVIRYTPDNSARYSYFLDCTK